MKTETSLNHDTLPDSKHLLCEVFSDREQLADFIQRNIPFCVKPTKKAKTAFVSVFTSENAMRVVIEKLTDSFGRICLKILPNVSIAAGCKGHSYGDSCGCDGLNPETSIDFITPILLLTAITLIYRKFKTSHL